MRSSPDRATPDHQHSEDCGLDEVQRLWWTVGAGALTGLTGGVGAAGSRLAMTLWAVLMLGGVVVVTARLVTLREARSSGFPRQIAHARAAVYRALTVLALGSAMSILVGAALLALGIDSQPLDDSLLLPVNPLP